MSTGYDYVPDANEYDSNVETFLRQVLPYDDLYEDTMDVLALALPLDGRNCNETIFSSVGALRLTLMMQWYSKVSIADLSVLSITAILGNIGQLLIAQEIARLGKKDEFFKLMVSEGIQIAEEKIMHTTTPSVSSDIMYYWKLGQDIVDAVRFSDHPKNAPPEIARFALANHIVYRLVKLDGTIESTIPVQFVKVLEKRGMKVEVLAKALKNVIELSKK